MRKCEICGSTKRVTHCHKGYMKDYQLAKKIVEQSIKGKDPEFASWF